MPSTDYPLYAAAFVDESRLLVGGGGGEGRHGVKNKLSIVNTSTGAIITSHELAEGEDNPTCACVAGELIYVGANRGSEAIRNRQNKHLRVFTPELEEEASVDALRFTNEAAYQKAISATTQFVAAISDCPDGGALQVLRTTNLKPLWSDTGDFQDVAISPSGKYLAAATAKVLTIYEAETGKVLATHPAKGSQWARLAFISDSQLIAGANIVKKRAKLWQLQITADGLSTVRSRSVPGKSLTCLKACDRAVAVGTAGGDIYLYTKDLSSLRSFRAVLKFPVTSLAIHTKGERALVAGTTLDGSYVIHDASLKPFYTTLWWVLVSTIAIALIALCLVGLIGKDRYPFWPKEAQPAQVFEHFEKLFVEMDRYESIES